MAQTANARIVIIWEHQLVAAAKALKHAYDLEKADRAPKELAVAWEAAMRACYAAIYSPDLASGCQCTVLSAKRAVAEQSPPDAAPEAPTPVAV